MKKVVFITLFILFSHYHYGNTIFQLQISKGERVENSYSTNIGNSSLHFFHVRKRNIFGVELRGFYVSSNNKVTELTRLHYPKSPVILASHINNEQLLFFTHGEEELRMVMFNLNTGAKADEKIQKTKIPSYIFKFDNHTSFMELDNKNRTVKLLDFEEDFDPLVKELNIPKQLGAEKHWFFNQNFDVIYQNEFVEKGSIGNSQLYLSESRLTALNHNTTSNEQRYFFIDLDKEGHFEENRFDYSPFEKTKYATAYLFDNKIFRLNTTRKNAAISIVDLEENKLLKTITGTDIFYNQLELEEYTNHVRKKSVLPTLTVNGTTNTDYAIRIDYANIETYQYNWWFHDWMFHWQQQMIWQQQQQFINQNLPKFQPNPAMYDDIVLLDAAFFALRPIEFVVNQQLERVAPGAYKTVHPYLDTETLIKALKENKVYKSASFCFVNEEMRFVYFDKKQKQILIKSRNK